MKNIFIALFTILTFSLNAQMSPPTVTRSGNSLTQQDSYLTVAKRLGIPTSSTDNLDAAVTAQNSIKLLYNTTLGQLRLYNPVTMTWSGIGGDGDFIPLAGTEIGKPVTGTIDFDWSDTETGASAKIDYDEGIVISRNNGISTLQAEVFSLTKYTDTTYKTMTLSIGDSALVFSPAYQLNGVESNIVGFKGSKVFEPLDSTYFVQKKYVDSVFSSGGGSGGSFNCTDLDTCQTIIDLQTALTNLQNSLPKTLVKFNGTVSYTGTTTENILFSQKITSDNWKSIQAYVLTFLGTFQAYATANSKIRVYFNTTNTLDAGKKLLHESPVVTNNTASPLGGSGISIHLPMFKNNTDLATNSGADNIGGIMYASTYNNTVQNYRRSITPDFTGDLYLIISCENSAAGNTATITNVLFKEM